MFCQEAHQNHERKGKGSSFFLNKYLQLVLAVPKYDVLVTLFTNSDQWFRLKGMNKLVRKVTIKSLYSHYQCVTTKILLYMYVCHNELKYYYICVYVTTNYDLYDLELMSL